MPRPRLARVLNVKAAAVSRFRANSDGTVDWVGLTGDELAVVFYACARSGFTPHSRDVDTVERVALEALGGCMAIWECRATKGDSDG